MSRLAALHFWPAWPKAEVRACFIARSRSASALTMTAFLPPVSAKSGARRGQRGELARGGGAAREDDGVDARVGDQRGADGLVVAVQELEHVAGDAGGPEDLGEQPADQRRLGGGLEDRRVSGGQRREDAAGGDGEREVPGRGHHHDAAGLGGDLAARQVGAERAPIVLGEVDGLGDLAVAFGDGLGGVGDHRTDELAAGGAQALGGGRQDAGAGGERVAGPGAGGGAGGVEGAADQGLVGERGLVKRLSGARGVRAGAAAGRARVERVAGDHQRDARVGAGLAVALPAGQRVADPVAVVG
jgi:hypothetical protein